MKIAISHYGCAPKNGDDFGQKDVTDAATGERLACITRDIEWTNIGIMTGACTHRVLGHTVELYDVETDAARALDGRTFAKLSDATAALRAHFKNIESKPRGSTS